MKSVWDKIYDKLKAKLDRNPSTEEVQNVILSGNFRRTEMETVDMIASGYEWVCPNCETLNSEIEAATTVTCVTCSGVFETNPPEHALG